MQTIISLFVRNLRLLKFDLLQDWPAITPASLGNQDARTRIRCAEWALYQLFRVYDPATTSDKLQPFFPPLEPLQSINLRAALYRCLDGLKKGGVLGRETVLRKSMLDDCQGDKFWELCLSFSTIVLRKAVVDKTSRHKHGKPLAQRLGIAQGLSRGQKDSMLPLAIAHKAALAKVLSEKERRRQTYDTLFDVFVDKESDLHDRKADIQHRRVKQSRAAIAEEMLEQDWLASEEVRSALLNGDDAAGGDSLLTKSFAQVWAMNEKNRLFWSRSAEVGLLEGLEHRTRQQKQRLQRWQKFHDKLVQSKQPTSKGGAGAVASKLRFDQHRNMTLRDMACDPNPPSPKQHKKHDSVMKYDEILSAMREELRKTSAMEVPRSPKKKDPEITPRPRQHSYDARKPSITSLDGTSEQHHRTHSQTAVPFRPQFGRRVSSRSRSYQQPKVIRQLEPIPLKSEIFSPLKTKGIGMSPASDGRMSVFTSPVEESPGQQMGDVVGGAAAQHSRQDSTSSLALAISTSSTPSKTGSGTSTPQSARSSYGNHDSAVEMPMKASTLGPAGRNLDGMGRTVRPSLADRTRMSMALKSTEDSGDVESDAVSASTDKAEVTDEPETTALERRATLQERTRQSISLAPQPVPKVNKRSSHARSRTSTFPVNQFETPPRRSTVSISVQEEEHLPRRDITPRDKLFEEDAEYASIFKPRPKIKLSPIVSPDAVGHDHDSDVEGSPLVGRENE